MMKKNKQIAMGADHGGFLLKEEIKKYLQKQQIEIIDKGTVSLDSVDYPDYAQKVVAEILKGKASLGILCCGTGIGMSIAANRFKGIRAALIYDENTAKMAKKHNNANVICLGGRCLNRETALTLVEFWLKEDFEGLRHSVRLEKMDRY
jgi:ribose 5-phosphate isomerase B